jgi:predicted Rossmann fold flavoprotein
MTTTQRFQPATVWRIAGRVLGVVAAISSSSRIAGVMTRRGPQFSLLLLLSGTTTTTIVTRTFCATALSAPSPIKRNHHHRIAVIGGGASGIFSSIAAAERLAFDQQRQQNNNSNSNNSQKRHQQQRVQVVVLEATSNTLQKVKISGGGRCNVLHDTSKAVSTILAGYPRGQKELNGLYHKHFTPSMAKDWFERRGVELKVEEDGRMFPISDSSQTIIDTLMDAADNVGVDVRLRQKVNSIECTKNGQVVGSADDGRDESTSSSFTIRYKDGDTEEFSAIVLATGSTPAGYALAESLGHKLVKPVPSLFTLNCKHATKEDGILYGLAGISVPFARVSLSKKLAQEGPLLITHHGISGPAALRLSAFAAREFHDINYRSTVTINWDTPLGGNQEEIFEQLWKVTSTNPKRTVASACPLQNNSIPRRLWSALVLDSGCTSEMVWGDVSKKIVRQLAKNIVEYPLETTGKGTFKEEFVTAGGVNLKEINMKTMESKICPGLFLCGEVINVDGVTGGYNFMNCWSTGFVAGNAAVDRCMMMPDS